ncbi:MAG: UPF0182 family protein [Bacteroidales bacterium]
MYTAIILILIAISAWFIYKGIQNKKRGRIYTGSVIIALTIGMFWFMDFWGDKLWFDALGFGDRFWIEIVTKAVLMILGAGVSALLVHLFTRSIAKDGLFYKYLALIIAVIYGASWGYSNWEGILKFMNSVSAGIAEPILNKDAGFYMFHLPFYHLIVNYFLVISIISVAAVLLALYSTENRPSSGKFDITHGITEGKSLIYSGTIFLLLLAADKFLARYDLLFSDWGVVSGPGWSDVHLRLPGYTISAVIALISALFLALPSTRRWLMGFFRKTQVQAMHLIPAILGSLFGINLIVWLIVLAMVPGAFQWLKVEPNEISVETPYIAHNIEHTRYAFELDGMEEVEYPVSESFNEETVEKNQGVFSNIRLWDWQALDEVYKQFQEIRLYYEFTDVDIDRYVIDSSYRQVMVSAREMNQNSLPEQSQTFVNHRFKYTHGYGITLTNVTEFTENGLPNLLIRDIPPVSSYPELEVERPEIYYGELTNTHVIVNSEEEEFDYPSGDKNRYTRYQGKGGVQLSNVWRRFLFGWKFDGTRLFFSGYPRDSSRIMFNRNIKERVEKVAPFLKFDEDPYIVLADGKLYWMVDAYTTSNSFPYSEAYDSREEIDFTMGDSRRQMVNRVAPHFHGDNYVRNSVKLVIDAYEGSLDFYVFNEDDPVINVWKNIFPDMFKSKDEMPESLNKHIRYPVDKMLVQGQVYSKYHMTDPVVFYNQEDLWIRATEKYYNTTKPVDPYYIMWERPGSNELEFVLMQPFTPKNRQVMIGWIAGMSDGENYGDFLAYKFPKDKRILGPQQVETKIDQDSFLSGQLSLWNQRGSSVIRGNVLAIPVDNTMIYVEPIYLQSESAAYPELRLVVVMHNDKISYADNFQEALEGIYGEMSEQPVSEEEIVEETLRDQATLIRMADDALQEYLEATGQGDFDKAAQAMKQLRESLDDLSEKVDTEK